MLAQMLISASTGARRLVSFASEGGSTTTASSFSFTDRDIGAATSDRVIVVCVMASGASGRTISGVTIAGNAATLATKNASFRKCTGIYYLAVASGVTATIGITFSGSVDEVSFACFSLTNWGTVTLHDSGSATVSSTKNISVAGIDTPTGGVEFAVVAADLVWWTITPGGLLDYTDHVFTSATSRFRTFRDWSTTSATGTTVTAGATSASDQSLSVASFA